MAIFHLQMNAICRKSGRSSTAAVAYRAGARVVDERTGEIYDYTRRRGVESADVILPGGGTVDRADVWNRIEKHHKRADAVTAREIEVSLPAELTADQRRWLALAYGSQLADSYGVLVDVAIHAPDRRGDERNHHAHITLSACSVSPDGQQLGRKVEALDPIRSGRLGNGNLADTERKRWALLVNAALATCGHDARIDHRSHADRGIEADPGQHLGPTATAIERRTGEKSRRRQWIEEQQAERAAARAELDQVERELFQARRELAEIEAREQAEQERQAIDLSALDQHVDLGDAVVEITVAKAAPPKAQRPRIGLSALDADDARHKPTTAPATPEKAAPQATPPILTAAQRQQQADRAAMQAEAEQARRQAIEAEQARRQAIEAERQRRARVEARIEAERQARIAALPDIKRNRAGAAYILADMALDALQRGRVDWQQVEKAAVMKALKLTGQNAADILSDVIEVSPGMADPVKRAAAQKMVPEQARAIEIARKAAEAKAEAKAPDRGLER